MNLIDRYILSTVLSTILVVLLILVGLDFVFAFIAELEDIEGNYQIKEAAIYILWTVPKRIYEFIPLSTLIGCLVGLGTLANNSELVVMRAAGVSLLRIVWSAMKPAVILMVVGFLLGQYVVPFTQIYAQSQRSVAQSGDGALKSSHGHWRREANTFIHINAIKPGGVLIGVTSYAFEEDSRVMLRSSFAERAIFQEDHWLLEKVSTTYFHGTHTDSKQLASEYWETELTPDHLSVAVLEAEHLSITDLYELAFYLDKQDLDASEYYLAFWKKVFQPATTATMVLIAISFIFGPLRSSTTGFRVFVGVLVGLIFRYIHDLLAPSSIVFQFSPVWAELVPITIFMLLGLFLLRRAA